MSQAFYDAGELINCYNRTDDDFTRSPAEPDESDDILADIIERSDKPRENRRKQKGDGVRPAPAPQSVKDDNGTFTRVENAVANLIGLSLGATALYVYIAGQCYGSRSSYCIGLEQITTRFNCSPTTAEKYITELVNWKLLSVERRGKMKYNRYTLLLRLKKSS